MDSGSCHQGLISLSRFQGRGYAWLNTTSPKSACLAWTLAAIVLLSRLFGSLLVLEKMIFMTAFFRVYKQHTVKTNCSKLKPTLRCCCIQSCVSWFYGKTAGALRLMTMILISKERRIWTTLSLDDSNITVTIKREKWFFPKASPMSYLSIWKLMPAPSIPSWVLCYISR